jgi:selenocysteine lyase/cysteine desulfurase
MSLKSPINAESVRSLRGEIPALRRFHSLNSGGLSSMPQATFAQLLALLEQEFVQTGAHPDIRADYEQECHSLRREPASLLGAQTEEVALIRAVSEVISFVASALSLSPGDRVILSAEEHKNGYLPWLALRDRLGIDVVALEATGDDEQFIHDLHQAITPNNSTSRLASSACIRQPSATSTARGHTPYLHRGESQYRGSRASV